MRRFCGDYSNFYYHLMNIHTIRYNFILIQILLHALFASALTLFNLRGSCCFLGVMAVWYILSYLYIFCKELKKAEDFQPFWILILASIQFAGINGLNNVFRLLDGEILKFGVYPINGYITNGMFYVSLQHLLLYCGYCIADIIFIKQDRENKTHTLYHKIQSSDYPYFKVAVYVYCLVWALRGINQFYPLSSVGSLINSFATHGHLLSLILLIFAEIQNRSKVSPMGLHWIIVVLEIGLALDLGMKEKIIKNLIPYVFLLCLQYKAKILRMNVPLILRFGALFFFAINVFIYVNVFRSIANRKHVGWSSVSVSEAVSGYIDYVGNMADEEDIRDKGLDSYLSRAGSVGCNAWAVNYAQTKCTKPDYLYYCSVGLIPRFLWPNKPNLQVGGMMYRIVTGHEDSWNLPIGKNTCSVSIGFIGSCYFSLGLWGAIIIPLFMGFYFNIYWRVLKKYFHESLICQWAFIAMVFVFLKDCESLQDCGMIFVAWSCVYMLIIKFVHLNLSR